MTTLSPRVRLVGLAGLGLSMFACGGGDSVGGGPSGSVDMADTGAASQSGSIASGSSGGTAGGVAGSSGSGTAGLSGGSAGSTGGSTSGASTGTATTGSETGMSGAASGVAGAATSGSDSDAGGTADANAAQPDSGAPDSSSSTPEASTGGGYKPCPPKGTPCVILPLGDSITYGINGQEKPFVGGGYRVELFSLAVADNHSITFVGSQSDGPATVSGKPFPPENEGHAGYSIEPSTKTSGGLSPLVDGAMSTYKPNIVLLMIGTNDMRNSIDLPNAPARLGKMIDQIATDKSDALIVVAQIPAANGAQETPAQAYNAAIPDLVKQRVAQGKHVLVVDMHTALGPWTAPGATSHFSDSEHPNTAGYLIMGRTWYAAISNILP